MAFERNQQNSRLKFIIGWVHDFLVAHLYSGVVFFMLLNTNGTYGPKKGDSLVRSRNEFYI